MITVLYFKGNSDPTYPLGPITYELEISQLIQYVNKYVEMFHGVKGSSLDHPDVESVRMGHVPAKRLEFIHDLDLRIIAVLVEASSSIENHILENYLVSQGFHENGFKNKTTFMVDNKSGIGLLCGVF